MPLGVVLATEPLHVERSITPRMVRLAWAVQRSRTMALESITTIGDDDAVSLTAMAA